MEHHLLGVPGLTAHRGDRPRGVVSQRTSSLPADENIIGTESGEEQKSIRLHPLFPLYLPDLSLGRRGWHRVSPENHVGCCLVTCSS